jgi:hypothetical protein
MEVIKVEPDIDSEVYPSSPMGDSQLTYLQPEKHEIKVNSAIVFVSMLCNMNCTVITVLFFDSCATC